MIIMTIRFAYQEVLKKFSKLSPYYQHINKYTYAIWLFCRKETHRTEKLSGSLFPQIKERQSFNVLNGPC